MSPTSQNTDSSWLLDVVHQVARASEAPDRHAAVEALNHGGASLDRSTVRRLFDETARLAREDQDRALMVSDLATRLADLLNDDLSRALAKKAKGFLLYLRGDYADALDHFEEASELFLREGDELEYAATLSTSVTTLSYLSRYDEAYAALARAREIFQTAGQDLRLARLDTNEGNVLFRQERVDEAQRLYRSALQRLRALEAPPQDIAAALHNIVTCAIALHDFDGALAAYEETREHCKRFDMAPVAAQAEYNIAYLYFLRGEYERSLELYKAARLLAQQADDRYHLALCDLDQAEILLELNMSGEGARLADAARTAFEKLQLGYEAAKATVFLAIAASQRGQGVQALDLFEQARESFDLEGNRAWVSIIDLYRAVIYHDEKRFLEARKLALTSLDFFQGTSLVSKSVLCELILARVALETGDLDQSGERVLSAIHQVEALDRPALAFRVRLIAAQVAEARDDPEAALEALQESADLLEDLRSHLRAEDLKLAFLRDKSEVYEGIVHLTMAQPDPSDRAKRLVFQQIERAKSRTLADLVSFRVPVLPVGFSGQSRLVDEMRRLRNELNWYYRQIDVEEIKSASARGDETDTAEEVSAVSAPLGSVRLRDLYQKSREHENDLMAALADLRATDADFGSLQTASVLDLEAIRAALPEDTVILELFEARDLVFGCCIGKSSLEVVPLTTKTLVRKLQHKLTFQLSKFRLGSQYLENFTDTLLASTRQHLGSLYRELVAPVRSLLDAEHLVIVPHGGMHYLPFHAFLDEQDRYLIDDFSISYAPSANVYALCAGRSPSTQTSSLVLGISSPEAPAIGDEAEAVALTLPESTLLQGELATEEALRRESPGARRLHVATHGFFRQDNPMFSAIQLGGGSRLTLYDLYSLRLDADLVVLSGCGTGLNVIRGGDELIGLSRGLLYAGARSVVASLWDVHDQSAVALMTGFYESLVGGEPVAAALRTAMLRLRESHPHPYYWAPFVVLGQFAPGPSSPPA